MKADGALRRTGGRAPGVRRCGYHGAERCVCRAVPSGHPRRRRTGGCVDRLPGTDPGRHRSGSSGRGVVTVSVSLDRSALAAIGGTPALAAQLQDRRSASRRRTVTGPGRGPGRRPWCRPATATPPPLRPAPWWPTWPGAARTGERGVRSMSLCRSGLGSGRTRRAAGQVDLRCGVNCFGDSGLTSALGFPTGVNPASLAGPGNQPDQVFTFSLDARLPGHGGQQQRDGSARWKRALDAPPRAASATRRPHPNLEHRSHRGGDRDRRPGRHPGCGAGRVWWLRRRRRKRGHARRRRGKRSEMAASAP